MKLKLLILFFFLIACNSIADGLAFEHKTAAGIVEFVYQGVLIGGMVYLLTDI